MPFIDTRTLKTVERLPGWHGQFFHSPSMTFANYAFTKGSSIHEHSHEQEEVWQIVDGELEITIDGVAQVAGPGVVGVVLPTARPSPRAPTEGRAFVAVFPLRETPG